jgi:predicted Zn-dependent protease
VVKKRFYKLLCRLPSILLLAPFPGILLCQPAHSANPSEMDREFQAAMAAEDAGDTAKAEALLSALHQEHPEIFAVNESLGLLMVSRGDVSGALPLLAAAVREEPGSDVAHANLGAAYYQLHRRPSALSEFEQTVRLNPRNVSAQESLGRLYMETNRPDEGAKALLAALRLKPDDSDLKLDCVTAMLAANRLGEAQNLLSTVADAEQSARAQSLLGELEEKQGKSDDASLHFSRAVQLDPSEANAWQLGCELLKHWAFDAAQIEFHAASAKFPASKRLQLGLGAALFGDAKYAEAIPVFADLLASDPNNAMYANLLGISCNAPLDAVSPRCSELVRYAQTHPADAQAAAYAASSLLAQNDDDQSAESARKLLQRALATDPNLAEAQFEMGVVLQEGSDWKGSIPYLERAVKLKPDYSQAHYRLARAYWKTGRRQEGDEQMQLQKKSAREEQEELHRRLVEITSLAVSVHP